MAIIVEGMSSDYYLINNPIWVNVTTTGLTDEAASLDVHVAINPGGEIIKMNFAHYQNKTEFDASVIAKSFLDMPKFNPNLGDGEEIEGNLVFLDFYLFLNDANGDAVQSKKISKKFVRGGVLDGYNAHTIDGKILKESEALPRWSNYPFKYYKIDGREIRSYIFIQNNEIETEQMRIIGCDPLYINFLNSKGGYSTWLFENYNLEVATGNADTIKRMRGFDSLGADNEYSISVESRVQRKYYGIMRALAQSPEVYVYDIANKFDLGFDNSDQSKEWTKVHNNGNQFNWNGVEDVKKVSFNFDGVFSENTSLVW